MVVYEVSLSLSLSFLNGYVYLPVDDIRIEIVLQSSLDDPLDNGAAPKTFSSGVKQRQWNEHQH